MKANEAPDKIYRTTTYLDGDRGKTLWKTKPVAGAENIEYTRTDVFIEKAVSYLNSELYDWVRTTNPNQRSYANTTMKRDFIKDFKKYMKGE